MNTAFAPFSPDQLYYPLRYAYFREGDLYVMGGPLFQRIARCYRASSLPRRSGKKPQTTTRPYVAFRDVGSPFKDGKIDAEFIRTFGITLPEKHYLLLGDNHARSADSRTFGFVPQANLQGAPSLLIWPPGERFGLPASVPHGPLFTLPRLIVWSIVLLIFAGWYYREHRMMTRPLYRKASS